MSAHVASIDLQVAKNLTPQPTFDMSVGRADSSDATGLISLPGIRRHLRGRRGGLKDMPAMPLDILFEIFGVMYPRDLLNLARTTRSFRTLLTSRRSTSFWTEAREQIEGLPKPPYYLSEPAYANLLFFPHCHNCLKSNIHTVIWVFSARYCRSCQKDLLTTNHKDMDDVLWKIADGNPSEWNDLRYRSQIFRRYNGKIFKPEVEMIHTQWAARDGDEKDAYLNERKAFVVVCREYAQLLSEWKEEYQTIKSAELDSLRLERLSSVKVRLREEGWGHALDDINTYTLDRRLLTVKALNRASKLTDQAWKIMRTSLIGIMTTFNEERLDRKYNARLKYLKEAIQTYRASHFPRRTAESDREPGFAEFAHLPDFRDLIMQEEPDDIVQASLLSLIDDIPNYTAAWVYRNEEVFVQKALTQLGNDFEVLSTYPPAFLRLAIVSFTCTQCRRPRLRWPGILAHHCLRQSSVPDHTVSSAIKNYEVAILRHTNNDYDAPFQGEELTVFDQNVNITRAVICACGFDPTTATYDELEGCGARFAPLGADMSRKPVYDWQGVIRYLIDHQGIEVEEEGDIILSDYFERVSDADAAIAIQHEHWFESMTANTEHALSLNDMKVFGCTLCPAWGYHPAMQTHLRDKHNPWGSLPLRMESLVYLHEDSKPQGAPMVFLNFGLPELEE
ncbi:hypothetical protein BD309DRAFT_955381 [Dichomitus squalens]|nr:hypothetical protein BD309DRAFT_955381 [Dichomitus squalens]